jgi:hypothetical protein
MASQDISRRLAKKNAQLKHANFTCRQLYILSTSHPDVSALSLLLQSSAYALCCPTELEKKMLTILGIFHFVTIISAVVFQFHLRRFLEDTYIGTLRVIQ